MGILISVNKVGWAGDYEERGRVCGNWGNPERRVRDRDRVRLKSLQPISRES